MGKINAGLAAYLAKKKTGASSAPAKKVKSGSKCPMCGMTMK